MGWFVPTDREGHPCHKPTLDEAMAHRDGEMWRCEVCDQIWCWEDGEWESVCHWRDRWRYRKQGYNVPERTRGPHDD